MLHIGCHLSSAKGFEHMGKEALSIGANTFQFFTRNPRGGKAKELDEKDIEKFLKLASEHQFGKLVAHAPYTVNPCSKDQKTREFAHMVIEDDLRRMEYLPGNYYNFHPGSHVGQGMDIGIQVIADLLNQLITPEQSTVVLLETMSGKGSEVGSRFEELQAIMEQIQFGDKIGVCLDTCHVHDAGYDISGSLDDVLDQFHQIIGLDKLHAIHINDSQNPLAAHKDRHAKIGEGHLGLEGIWQIVHHPRLRHLPFILETPNELEGYAREIALLRQEQVPPLED
ncbi:deoxyribonuclease IV [Aminipila butyrica]|uniref:Probable endonuclease 4 n=1 Tax=Aminipila butyrica TaxID=433296 RepID=A0A858BRZ5_9FIRM|nr:deoxyribonuclease IV [Aminipila butyrica]QIB67885.1 deoxyribonuclease IV [Aminipila butyrica]